jgi:hypothetical protein
MNSASLALELASGWLSYRRTMLPAWVATWAIPRPMAPAPMIPVVLNVGVMCWIIALLRRLGPLSAPGIPCLGAMLCENLEKALS